MTSGPDDFDEIVLDEDFVSQGVTEGSADERIAKAQRIARANNELRRAGEISDGSGKPAYHRVRRSAPWIAIAVAVSVAIVLVAVIAR